MLQRILLISNLLLASSFSIAQNYQVLLAAYSEPHQLDQAFFKSRGIENAQEIVDQNGIYVYIAGAYNSRLEAEEVLRDVRSKGFVNSYIIDIEEQRALCGKPCPYFNSMQVYIDALNNDKNIRNIFFDFGKTALNHEAKRLLDATAQTLLKNKDLILVIGGHADAVGSKKGNLQISLERARAARDYIINKGVEAERLNIKIFGEGNNDIPEGVFDMTQPENRKINRRVSLVITGKDHEVNR